MSLASLLPFRHRYAAGFPGLGSQAVPTDADALDYLDRMAAADGASVEVGVATAVDAFFADAKELGVFSSLKACCILAGARTLAGALVPVVGDAPAPNGFVSGDYSRTAGLRDSDRTSYLDSGRDGDDDPQNDVSLAVFATSLPTVDPTFYIGDGNGVAGANAIGATTSNNPFFYARSNSADVDASAGAVGLIGTSRSTSTGFVGRSGGQSTPYTKTSQTPRTSNVAVFAEGTVLSFKSDATLAFYSIGTSLSLEDLDTAVTNLINRLKFALLVGENPSGLDPDTIDYIVRGYEAGGSLE